MPRSEWHSPLLRRSTFTQIACGTRLHDFCRRGFSVCTVSIITLVSTMERAILRVASVPPIPCMFMSIMNNINGIGATPFHSILAAAGLTDNFNPFISSRMRRIPARTSSWSSTRRTLIKGIISRIRDNATDSLSHTYYRVFSSL